MLILVFICQILEVLDKIFLIDFYFGLIEIYNIMYFKEWKTFLKI